MNDDQEKFWTFTQAMGLQRSSSYKLNVQPKPIPETKNEENKVNGSINMRTPYLSDPS